MNEIETDDKLKIDNINTERLVHLENVYGPHKQTTNVFRCNRLREIMST
jgi:hypothetical protein